MTVCGYPLIVKTDFFKYLCLFKTQLNNLVLKLEKTRGDIDTQAEYCHVEYKRDNRLQ